MTTIVRVPEELSARVPAEQRGPGRARDDVRLLVSRGTRVTHHVFRELPGLLGAGDVGRGRVHVQPRGGRHQSAPQREQQRRGEPRQ